MTNVEFALTPDDTLVLLDALNTAATYYGTMTVLDLVHHNQKEYMEHRKKKSDIWALYDRIDKAAQKVADNMMEYDMSQYQNLEG